MAKSVVWTAKDKQQMRAFCYNISGHPETVFILYTGIIVEGSDQVFVACSSFPQDPVNMLKLMDSQAYSEVKGGLKNL